LIVKANVEPEAQLRNPLVETSPAPDTVPDVVPLGKIVPTPLYSMPMDAKAPLLYVSKRSATEFGM